MNKTLSLVALTMMTGCLRTSGSWEGIWFVQIPVSETSACETDIKENFKDAAVPDVEVIDSEWTYTTEFDGSNAGVFLQVLMQDGNAVGVIDGSVYVGTADAKTLTLNWEGYEDSEETEEHDQGYFITQIDSATTSETLTLTKGKKNTYTGSWAVDVVSKTTYVESDEWDRDDVGFNQGSIPAQVLEGDGNENRFDVDECTGDECELTLSTTCKGSEDITASFVGKHNEGMFGSVEDANRDFGTSGY
jgi:hypothetical protein